MATFNTFCDPNTGATVRNDSAGTGFDAGQVFGNCSAVFGGIPAATPTNKVCPDLSVIVMGDTNVIDFNGGGGGCFNFIGNGAHHCVSGEYNFIGNGNNNKVFSSVGSASVFGGVIVGGENNLLCDNGTITANDAFIGAGSDNCIFGDRSAVVGGLRNTVKSSCSFIGGGGCNIVHQCYDFDTIAGGCQNAIGNSITAGNGFTTGYSFIGAGTSNCIDSTPTHISKSNSIVGGKTNRVFAGSVCSAIVGGGNNQVQGGASFVGGGNGNLVCSTLSNVNCSSIVGGEANLISDNSVVTADFSFIGGGSGNNVLGVNSFIGSGGCNIAAGAYSFVGGGGGAAAANGNAANGDLSFVGGGITNIAACTGSFIGGGAGNCVAGEQSFVGGGQQNCVTSSLGAVNCSVIVGGFGNLVCDDGVNPVVASFIGGGVQNKVCGSCSAILGGAGNSDGGFPYTGIFGVGITASAIPSGSGAMWVNELVVPSIPMGTLTPPGPPVGYPSWSLYWLPSGVLKQVYVV